MAVVVVVGPVGDEGKGRSWTSDEHADVVARWEAVPSRPHIVVEGKKYVHT